MLHLEALQWALRPRYSSPVFITSGSQLPFPDVAWLVQSRLRTVLWGSSLSTHYGINIEEKTYHSWLHAKQNKLLDEKPPNLVTTRVYLISRTRTRCQIFSLLSNPHRRHAHTSTDAHARDTDLLSSPPQLVEQGADLAGAGAAERVAEGDGAALGVDLALVQAKLVGAPHALRGEGLVDLEDVDIILVDAGLLEDLGDGGPWTDTHQEGSDAGDRCSDVLAENGLAESLGSRALHEKHGSSAVGDLARVSGVDRAVLGKGGLDLAQALGSYARSDAVILGDGDLLDLAGLGVLPGYL
jgi:hypothetical protein